MPDAKVDDGILDAVVVAPKGAFGWVSVISDLVTRHRRRSPPARPAAAAASSP